MGQVSDPGLVPFPNMVRIGLLGYPNVGKTTLFNALTGLEAFTAPHPYSTTEPRIGTVQVDDPLLDQVAALEGSRRVTHAALELLDLPAVRSGSVRGLGAGHELDLMLVVLRSHQSGRVPSEHGTDPVSQAEELLVEMALSDFEMFERRLPRLLKEAAADPALRPTADAITKAGDYLAKGIPLRQVGWSDPGLRAFRDMAPLSLLPCVWAINMAEDDYENTDGIQGLRQVLPDTDPVLAASALLEEEASRMDPSERLEIYQGFGMGEGVASQVVRAVYEALQLITFYTVSRRESRAWTISRGTPARRAAGRVHSDLERGFIRAEIASIEDVIRLEGWDNARAGGITRVEGKDYQVADGDVVLVRFSV